MVDVIETEADVLSADAGPKGHRFVPVEGADNLFLDVRQHKTTLTKNWVRRWQYNGLRRSPTLGLACDDHGIVMTLAEAKDANRSLVLRLQRDPSYNPADERRANRKAEREARDRGRQVASETVEFVFRIYVRQKTSAGDWAPTSLRNEERYFGHLKAIHLMPLTEVTEDTFVRKFKAAWTASPKEHYRAICAHFRCFWDWAKENGYCSGDNPAIWKTKHRKHLAAHFPDPEKLRPSGRMKAPPISDVPAGYARLVEWEKQERTTVKLGRKYDLGTLRFLRFLILDGGRIGQDPTNEDRGETRPMRWGEIDWANKLWKLPVNRIKTGKDLSRSLTTSYYPMPLSDECMQILKDMRHDRYGLAEPGADDYVWGSKEKAYKRPITYPALRRAYSKVFPGYSPHGIRTTRNTWLRDNEYKEVNESVREARLTHVPEGIKAVYLEGVPVRKLRQVGQLWADVVTGKIPIEPVEVANNVVPLRGA